MTDVDGSVGDSAGDSRRRLVLAAVELVLEHFETGTGLRDVFAYLTPGAVADRAGVSRGLIYHHWGNVDADGAAAFGLFLEAVSDEIWSRSVDAEDLAALAELLPDNQSDLIRGLTTFEFARITGPEATLWRAAEVLLLHGALPKGDAETVISRLAALYELALAKVGREVVPPLTYEDLALSVSCVFEGFANQTRSSPERVQTLHDWNPVVEPLEGEPGWTLLAITVESIMEGMTRPLSA